MPEGCVLSLCARKGQSLMWTTQTGLQSDTFQHGPSKDEGNRERKGGGGGTELAVFFKHV